MDIEIQTDNNTASTKMNTDSWSSGVNQKEVVKLQFNSTASSHQ